MNKKNRLIEELNKRFPTINAQADFYLSAFYGGIADGIPIIGQYEQYPNCYFLFAFGDNGTVYGASSSNPLLFKSCAILQNAE